MNTPVMYNAFDTIPQACFQPLAQWTPPSGDDVRSTLRRANLTAEDFARIIGVDGRTVRRWTCDEIVIPYASWCLLALEAGSFKFWGKGNTLLK